VNTDKAAYLAGETIHISGSGFLPFDNVMLQVKHDDGGAESGTGHGAWFVNIDAAGAFTSAWSISIHDNAGINFVLGAAGAGGISAETKFTRIATIGNRTLDFNTEGLVHIGLLPELIEDARRDAVSEADLEPLFRSAEGYIRMWERSEERGAALRGG
jgi:hypothetical protein